MFSRKLGVPVVSDLSPFDKIRPIEPNISINDVYYVLLRIIITIISLLCIMVVHVLIYIPYGSNEFLYEVYVRYPMELIGWLFVTSFNVTKITFPRSNTQTYTKRNHKTVCISISNHGSFLDSAIFVTILRNRAVGKFIPYYALGFRSAQQILKCVMVKRDVRISRESALHTIHNYIKSSMKKISPDTFHFFVEGATMPVVPSYLNIFSWSLGAFRQKSPINTYYVSYKTPGNPFNCNYLNPSNLHDIFFTYFVPKEFKIEFVKRYYPPELETEDDIIKWANTIRKDYCERKSLRKSEYSFFDKFILKEGVNHNNNELLFTDYVPWCKLKRYFQGISFRDVLSFVKYLSRNTNNIYNQNSTLIKIDTKLNKYVLVHIKSMYNEEILRIKSVKILSIDECKQTRKGSVDIIGINNRKINIETFDLMLIFMSQRVMGDFGICLYNDYEDLGKRNCLRFYEQ